MKVNIFAEIKKENILPMNKKSADIETVLIII